MVSPRTLRRIVLLALLISICALPGCSRKQGRGAGSREVKGAPPNIFLVVIDTARADHFSFEGYGRRTTPSLDRLAEDSVLYRNAHSVAPWTLPAHMSMFTGLLPGEHGATWASLSQPSTMSLAEMLSRSPRLPAPERMLAVRLKSAGYNSLGISQNAWVSGSRGFATGFDRFIEAWREDSSTAHDYGAMPEGIRISPEVDGAHAGRSLLLFKEQFLRGELKAPFFVFFNIVDPHFPYHAPDSFAFKFGGSRRFLEKITAGKPGVLEMELLSGARKIGQKPLAALYDGELNYVDFVIGKLVEWLKGKGLYRESLIVVTSDHGEHLGEDGRYSHQLSMEEALLRIPLLVKYPQSRGAGTVVESPLVSNLDIYSTLLAAGGASGDEGTALGWSRNLARMDRFDRRILASEYHYSDAYLHQLANVNPAFDIEAHRKVRRVFYAFGRKYSFEGFRLVKTEELNVPKDPSGQQPAPEDLLRQMRAFIEILDSGGALKQGDTGRKAQETTETLRALGYVSETAPPRPGGL